MIGVRKGLVLYPEYAWPVASGVKTVETRPCAPNGSMRPAGERGLPGCRLEPFEPIVVVAGAPDKAAVAVTSVPAAFRTEQVTFDDDLHDPAGWRIVGDRLIVSETQRGLGNYEPGGWAWPLTPVVRLDPPVPASGRQGVFVLPDMVWRMVEAQTCGVTARTVWEHLRTSADMSGVAGRVPEWAKPWLDVVAGDLLGSYHRAIDEISELAGAGVVGPGPYQAHVRDFLGGDRARAEQRVWAQLRPPAERPFEVTF